MVLSFGILFHVSGYYVLIKRIEPFQHFAYLIFWWSYIMVIDALVAARTSRFTVLNRGLPLLILVSSAFWCIFEIINVRLENWFYVNLPPHTVERWAGYGLAYGTVIPAIYGTRELFHSLVGGIKVRSPGLKNYPSLATGWGLAALVLTLLFPAYCFPLAWVFPLLILDGYNYRMGLPSFVGELEQGSARNLLATLLSGLVCGLLWESWNFWSIAKWVYTVPFFEDFKIFEMPLPGYLGFPVFALSTIAFVNFFRNQPVVKSHLFVTASVSLAVSLLSFPLIDRYTAFSHVAEASRLSFIEEGKRPVPQGGARRTSFAINPALLDEKERSTLDLIHLKGLGYARYTRLKDCGIDSVSALSQSDERTLSRILHEPNLRRIRVYLKAARQAQSSQPREQ